MKYALVAVTLLACMLAACNASVPSRMTVSDTKKRRVDTEPGTSLSAQRYACADGMLNVSPVTEATDIDARVVATGDPVIIEVDAVLKNFGSFGHDQPVTYHCEYLGGSLTASRWVRGITQGSK
jgi:hypothetical protein